MKKLFFLSVVLATFFVSCTKDNAPSACKQENSAMENATVIVAGELSFSSKANAGSARIYRQKDGKYLLGLEGMNLNHGMPLNIYLSPTKTALSPAIKIFSVNSLYGNVFHVLPPNIDFAHFKNLIIQTEVSEEIIASADLN